MTKTKGASDLVAIAAIAGAHGVRGNVRIRSFASVPQDCFVYGPLLDEAGSVLIEPQHFHAAKDHFVVTPKVAKQKEEWDALKRNPLYVPADVLPETDEDEFYIRELVGLDVFAGGDAPSGSVKAVHNFGAGDILEIILPGEPKPILVPFTIEDIPVIDMSSRRIVVADLDFWVPQDAKPDDG